MIFRELDVRHGQRGATYGAKREFGRLFNIILIIERCYLIAELIFSSKSDRVARTI